MLRAAIYEVIGPGKAIIYAERHDGRMWSRSGFIIHMSLFRDVNCEREAQFGKLTISVRVLISAFLGPLMKAAAS